MQDFIIANRTPSLKNKSYLFQYLYRLLELQSLQNRDLLANVNAHNS